MSTQPTRLRIRYYGDPCLRRRNRPVKTITEKDRVLFEEMAEVMRLSGGVGLAASQVGINRQFLLIDIGQGLNVFVNPRITKRAGSVVMEEGCLSLPGVYVKVKRAKSVTVNAANEFNEKISIEATDLMARALQHEIDHLHGRLIIDYANLFSRLKLRKKIRSFVNAASIAQGKPHEL